MQKKHLVQSIVLLLLLSVALVGCSGGGVTEDFVEDQIKDAVKDVKDDLQDEVDSVSDKVEDLEADLKDSVSKVDDLDSKVDGIQEAIDTGAVAPVDESTKEEVVADPTETPKASFPHLEKAMNGDFDGEEVTVLGKWTEGEEEAFVKAMSSFADETGIEVNYEGSADFETLIKVRVEGGNAPDLAIFPQPGLMAEFARSGDIVDFGSLTDEALISENYSDAWTDLATVDGQLSGVFYRASTKSIVWYPVDAFEEAGYEIPETWDDMIDLSDTILEDQGVSPWCISIFHEGVTGWVATDWVEDVLLRTASPDVYDQWVSNEIPFDSPEIANAMDIVADLWFKDDYVYGGTDGILNIFVGDTQTPMFEDDPECWFHKQAGWIPSFWPDGTEAGVDSSFFYLPPIDDEFGRPVLGGGDVVSAFSDDDAVIALLEYMATAESAQTWVEDGGFISPNRAVPSDWYGNYVDQAQAEILQEATTLRFDASDLMPAEVGAGTFWEGMVDWVGDEGGNTEDVLADIEDSWPAEGGGVSSSTGGEFATLASAMAGDFDGEEVTILGKWTEGEEEAFVKAMSSFADETGIEVNYEGSADFETLIKVRVEGGNAPDLAIFPQPGLMAEFARSGDIVDFGSLTDEALISENYSDAWTDLATVDGQLSGVFYRASTKSIVWYPVDAFEEAGYEIPETWDDMIDLSDTILEEQGVSPWCISIFHEGVTGWVATDWVEDVLLRTASPDVYDQWVSNEIPFDSPEIANAMEIVADLWFKDDYVYGGTDGILNIFVGDTQTPMFEDEPECWFHKQAGWIPSFWPDGTEAGVDSSFFYLPPIDEEFGRPVLGGGDVVSAFSDDDAVIALLEYMATAESAQTWVEDGGFISPNRAVPSDWYGNYVDQAQAEILQEATTLRFDASDLMPAEVGAGTFWEGMVDWVGDEGGNTEDVLADIEDSWPAEGGGVSSGGSGGEFTTLVAAMAGDFDGEEVTILGKWTEGEEEAFVKAMSDFALNTGIDINYEGSADFETLVKVRVEGGNAPDLAIFPQPGLMAEFVESGDIVDFGSLTDADLISANYSDAWTDLATVDGQLSGVFYRASTKSIVWYPVEAFDEAGYEIPQTWDEMIDLSDTILEEQGVSPWCISIFHEGVTGWVATDWVEDVLLRTASPEVYDQWVSNEIPFDSPEIANAMEIVADLWFKDDYVYGGSDGILNIFVGDTQTPMFEDEPECWFHKQAGWIPSFWPDGTEAGVDSSFFYLPPIDDEFGRPVLGGGDVVSAFSDNDAVIAVLEYMATADAAKSWVEDGGFISPNRTVPTSWYGNYVDEAQAEILQEATTLRFDASDLMPAEVGAGTFWEGMVDWVSDDGGNTEEVLADIEDSWE